MGARARTVEIIRVVNCMVDGWGDFGCRILGGGGILKKRLGDWLVIEM